MNYMVPLGEERIRIDYLIEAQTIKCNRLPQRLNEKLCMMTDEVREEEKNMAGEGRKVRKEYKCDLVDGTAWENREGKYKG